ncbi:MAG TPA: zinc ribbon domain-containing protein [Pyrinomonadaceae bacterium]|nr:zinc ribbon domain-containing protein [Pyrinomonadaceae bacterium]
MFCPKCAAQNLEGASFCRTCGANISLVPQAMTGQIVQTPPPVEEEEMDESCGRRGRRRQLTLDAAFKNMFMGVAFLLISIALSRTIGAGWWFWMLIPAFSLMGKGVAQYIRLREQEKRTWMPPQRMQPTFQRQEPVAMPRRTDELMPPVPSVTEGTTRHLGVEAPTRHFEPQERK